MEIKKNRNDMTRSDSRPSGVTEKYSGKAASGLLNHNKTDKKR